MVGNTHKVEIRVDVNEHVVRDAPDNRDRAMPREGAARPSALQVGKYYNLNQEPFGSKGDISRDIEDSYKLPQRIKDRLVQSEGVGQYNLVGGELGLRGGAMDIHSRKYRSVIKKTMAMVEGQPVEIKERVLRPFMQEIGSFMGTGGQTKGVHFMARTGQEEFVRYHAQRLSMIEMHARRRGWRSHKVMMRELQRRARHWRRTHDVRQQRIERLKAAWMSGDMGADPWTDEEKAMLGKMQNRWDRKNVSLMKQNIREGALTLSAMGKYGKMERLAEGWGSEGTWTPHSTGGAASLPGSSPLDVGGEVDPMAIVRLSEGRMDLFSGSAWGALPLGGTGRPAAHKGGGAIPGRAQAELEYKSWLADIRTKKAARRAQIKTWRSQATEENAAMRAEEAAKEAAYRKSFWGRVEGAAMWATKDFGAGKIDEIGKSMDRMTYMMRAGSSFAMRSVRFAGPVGLMSLMWFSQNASFIPAIGQFVIRSLGVKGGPLNRDAVRAVGTISRDTMMIDRQRERDMGEDPLLLAYTNGYSPPDSFYTSQESVDRIRVQLGTRDYDHVGTRESVIVPGAA